MDESIKKMALIGYVAKGMVYAVTGILAFMTAFDLGGKKAGKLQIVEFLENQPFGKLILALLGMGLICYALWRFVQSIQDPEGMGTDKKATVKRISFFFSGLLYLALGIFALVDIFREPAAESDGSSSFLSSQTGRYLLIAIGIALAGKGLYQFFKAYKGDFLKKFNIKSISNSSKRTYIKNLGYAGLIARGVLVSIVAYFFLRAGLYLANSSADGLKGTSEAFSFLQQQSSGPWLLGTVATGLFCYGIYMFAMARYRQFND